METEKDDSLIDLSEYLIKLSKGMRKFWFIIVILALLFALRSYYNAKRSFVYRYESNAIFAVSSGYNPDNILSNSSVYDNAAAQQLASGFPNLLSTDIMRELILQQIDKGYINGSISARSFTNTNLLMITVRSTSAQDAYDILNAVIVSYPQLAIYMTENPSILIREAPTVPTEPYNSFSGKSATLSGFIKGALLGLLVVVVLSFLRRTVNTPDELKTIVNLPILAAFPQINQKKRRNSDTNILPAMRKSGFAESTREFRIKLRKQLEEDAKVIMITSTLPGEGKTTMSVNLARTLADDGKKVVLVDGDLHKQEIRPLLVTDGKEPDSVDLPGLIDCLENPNICLEDCLTNAPGMKFKFLSGNAADSTRSRLHAFDKKTIASFFEKLKEQFDYIILDTPPCGIVSDSGILCHYADSVIYVVKQDYAGRSQILDGINSLSDKNAPLTGCIINGISGTSHRYGYGYGYKYGYGYGYGYGHKYGYGKKSGYGYGNTEDDDANSESKDE